jgi:phytoene synthase
VAGGRADEDAGRPAPDDATGEVAAIARAGEPDRYLAALLAPPAQREALLALAAFAAELARIPHRAVREPFMGELRLQWWRIALGLDEGQGEGEKGGHAVADAVHASVLSRGLPAAPLADMIDARATELQPTPFEDDAALHDFLDKTEGTLFALGCRVVGLGDDGDVAAACTAAGRAYGLARLLLGLPRVLSLGRIPLAQTRIAAAGLTAPDLLAGADVERVNALVEVHFAQIRGSLAEARRLVRGWPRPRRIPFLPLALVPAYVRVLERRGGAALHEESEVLPLTRVWKVAAAHWSGRL